MVVCPRVIDPEEFFFFFLFGKYFFFSNGYEFENCGTILFETEEHNVTSLEKEKKEKMKKRNEMPPLHASRLTNKLIIHSALHFPTVKIQNSNLSTVNFRLYPHHTLNYHDKLSFLGLMCSFPMWFKVC